MKLLLTIFMSMIISLGVSQQTPYLLKDSSGNQFIVLSLEQARVLDNSTDYSPILWKELDCKSLIDSVYEKLFIEKEKQIQDCESVSVVLEKQNELLRNIITIDKRKLSLLEEKIQLQQDNYTNEINIKNNEIKKEKFSKKVITVISLLTVTGLLTVIFGG